MRSYCIHPKALLFFTFVVFCLSSCYKEPSFSLEPSIEFNSIRKFIRIDQFTTAKKDSVVMTIKFQDGDGDLGLNTEEIGKAQQTNNFNYVIKSYRRVKGNFQEYQSLIPISGFFPRLKDDGKVGPIEGTLSYSMNFEHAFIPKKDTVKFQIHIKDRAGNTSNVVDTEQIILNEF